VKPCACVAQAPRLCAPCHPERRANSVSASPWDLALWLNALNLAEALIGLARFPLPEPARRGAATPEFDISSQSPPGIFNLIESTT
jgi:hypothetical protein